MSALILRLMGHYCEIKVEPMCCESFRELTRYERELLDRLLSQEFLGRDEIANQLAYCRVRVIDQDGGLEIQSYMPGNASAVKSRVPTEGEAEDNDGVTIHFLLHVVNGAVCELEIYKEDNSRILAMPAANAVRVFAPG